jgi:uncharacterized protein YgiM (DUF1202 family)
VAADQAYVITGTVTEDNATLLKAVEDSVDSFTVLKDEELKSVTDSTVAGTTTAGQTSGNSTQEASSLNAFGNASTYYATDVVNVRSGPGTDTDVLTSFGKGDAVTVTGETNGWYQVSVNGATGYIRKDLLSTSQSGETTAQNTTQSAQASAEPSTAYNYGSASTMYATDGVNVRSEGSTNGTVLGTLYPGQEVKVVSQDGDWTHINYTDTSSGTTIDGYVASNYLDFGTGATTAA